MRINTCNQVNFRFPGARAGGPVTYLSLRSTFCRSRKKDDCVFPRSTGAVPPEVQLARLKITGSWVRVPSRAETKDVLEACSLQPSFLVHPLGTQPRRHFCREICPAKSPAPRLLTSNIVILQGGERGAGSQQDGDLVFMVEDVDREFARLKDRVHVVHEPKNLPWGNRNAQLSDPEGTRVALCTPVTEAAKRRLSGR